MNRYQRRGVLLLQAEKTARGPALCTFAAPEVSHSDVAVSHLVSSPLSLCLISSELDDFVAFGLLKSRSSSPLPSSRVVYLRGKGPGLFFPSKAKAPAGLHQSEPRTFRDVQFKQHD